MDPNHGAAAPHESYAGFWYGGLVHTALLPLYRAPKWHPSKKREKDRASTLGGHHLMGEYNNQPQVGVGEGLEGGGNNALGNNEGVGRFPIIWGV
jgi:hypothetical protein